MSSIIIFMPCNTDLQNVEIYYFYENILYAQNVYNCKKRKRRKPLAVPELYKKCKRFPLMLFSLIFMCHLFVFLDFHQYLKNPLPPSAIASVGLIIFYYLRTLNYALLIQLSPRYRFLFANSGSDVSFKNPDILESSHRQNMVLLKHIVEPLPNPAFATHILLQGPLWSQPI